MGSFKIAVSASLEKNRFEEFKFKGSTYLAW